VILKALDKDPELRYQTAKELVVDLERLQQAGQPRGSAHDEALHGAGIASPGRLRRWAPWALVVAGLGGLAAWLLWPPAVPRVTAVRALAPDLERRGSIKVGSGSWATDGERVYYEAPKGDGAALFQVPVTGGESTEVPLPFRYGVHVLGYVLGESALLVRGSPEPPSTRTDEVGLPLWLVPIPSGAPRRIPNLLARWADVAADGRSLALIQTGHAGPQLTSQLVLAQIDGSSRKDLGRLPEGAWGVRWAPDGRRLRFFAGGPGGSTWEPWIWEISVDGGAPRPLWPEARGDWTTDGRHYVFDREGRGASRRDLFAERESSWPGWRSGHQERLTVGPLDFWLAGSSHDGRSATTSGRSSASRPSHEDLSTSDLYALDWEAP
jgi:hypothetical protein